MATVTRLWQILDRLVTNFALDYRFVTFREAGMHLPHRWRYVLAGPTLGMDLVLLGPESGRAPLPLAETQVVDALSVLTGRWAA